MRKSKKITLIVAIGLVIVGLLISLGAFSAMGFDLTKLNTLSFETHTYSVSETFSSISVESAECDVRLLLSDDDTCKIVCHESDKLSHRVTVQDNTLSIHQRDDRRWYEYFGIVWGKTEILIYLPKSEFEAVYVQSISGDIEIPEDFSFMEADIHSTSGNVRFFAAVENQLSANTVSGDLYIRNATPKNLNLHSTSGDIKLSGVRCENVTAESCSGKLTFSQVRAVENIRIESVSGNVSLLQCDASSLWIKTTSGDVQGSLLTEKIFLTDTSSGEIDVPNSFTGGKCEIITTSGDIEIDIA